jgi:hypothetical protein
MKKKTFISRHILRQHWYTCPIALSVRQNPQIRNLLTVVSATSASPFQLLPSSAKLLPLSCEPFYATNSSPRKQETLLYEYLLQFCTQKRHNGTLLFSNKILKHGRHFDY